ncbi:4911_t:CDS:2 [Diversispora eburnea]|uniref:4911_t:CDS:1 n=1 Tax=Diversispora eburnea TaxID=1213867 RepID=A0A9N9AKC8_9GLOM|nr:4911_t:CDS:2 [Diversispora eburnea]
MNKSNFSAPTPKTQCQRCLEYGHWTAECKNDRVYKARPTRTQQLTKPLKPIKIELPEDLMPKKDKEIADKEEKAPTSSESESSSDSSSASSSSGDSDSETTNSTTSSEEEEESANLLVII